MSESCGYQGQAALPKTVSPNSKHVQRQHFGKMLLAVAMQQNGPRASSRAHDN